MTTMRVQAIQMSIEVPRLNNPYCHGFSACGAVRASDNEMTLLVGPKASGSLVARYQAAKQKMAMRFQWGKPFQHIHIDIVKLKHAPSLEEWGDLTDLLDITGKIDAMFGKTVDVSAYGRFELPISDLPPNSLIASTFFDAEAEGLKISLDAGQIRITDDHKKKSPGQTIRWIKRDKKMHVEIFVPFSSIFDAHYLNQTWDYVNSAFSALVLSSQPQS